MTSAERQRAYRARKRDRAARLELHCEHCGAELAFEHRDKRFCSSACRSADWRMVSRVLVEHREGGWPLGPEQSGYPGVERCVFIDNAGNVCRRTAAWRATEVRNRAPGAPLRWHHCDDHQAQAAEAGCPIDVEHQHHLRRGCLG